MFIKIVQFKIDSNIYNMMDPHFIATIEIIPASILNFSIITKVRLFIEILQLAYVLLAWPGISFYTNS